jgi:hypothetical protein
MGNRPLQAVVCLLVCLSPIGAEAQQFVCWPIVRGDTASALARRLTGSAAAAYSELFQINDPARRTFVPKSRYQRLSTDWQACVARDVIPNHLRASARVDSRALAAAPSVARPAPARDDIRFALRTAAAVSLTLVMLQTVLFYIAARPIPAPMQRAGEDFIKAFARPLFDPTSAAPPIATRLRFVRRSKHLEIGIAPSGGRRYPNLADHRRNVEYDVGRVMRIIAGHCVVCDRLYAEGRWVIVSIRMAEPRQAGAK